MEWSIKKLELSSEQLEGTKNVSLPSGAIPITLSAATLFYMKPEQIRIGSCQVIGCLEDATKEIKFECFRLKVCPTHGEEFGPQKEEEA